MVNPTPTNGYKLTIDGESFSADIAWKRDHAFTIQFYDPDDTAADFSSGGPYTVTITVRAHPYESSVLQTYTITGQLSGTGQVTWTITDADLSGLTWDLGQRMQVLFIDIEVENSTSLLFAVWDDVGNSSFPLRVHQTLKGVP